MLLSVHSRMVLLGMLPKEGSLLTLRLVRDFQQALGFSEEELAALKVEQAEGKVTWTALNPDGTPTVPPKEIAVGPELRKVVCRVFEPLDKDEKLTAELASVYEQFVEPKED